MDDSLIISCDASIKKNPGGPAAIGVSIYMGTKHIITFARPVNATTNNQAEYDAVYEAVSQLERVAPLARACVAVQIHSDSQLVVKQITGKYECQDPILKRRRDAIVERMQEIAKKVQLPPVIITWLPRNSTKGLKEANNAAQDELNVPNH